MIKNKIVPAAYQSQNLLKCVRQSRRFGGCSSFWSWVFSVYVIPPVFDFKVVRCSVPSFPFHDEISSPKNGFEMYDGGGYSLERPPYSFILDILFKRNFEEHERLNQRSRLISKKQPPISSDALIGPSIWLPNTVILATSVHMKMAYMVFPGQNVVELG